MAITSIPQPLLIGLGTAAGATALVGGLERLVAEPKHRPGEKFSDLAGWELAAGVVATSAAVSAGVAALCFSRGGYQANLKSSLEWLAASAGIAGGIIGGRMLNQASVSSPHMKAPHASID